METNIVKKNILLPKGGILEVDVTPKFIEVIRSHFDIPIDKAVDDNHIRMYVWGAFKNAIDKAERNDS